MNREQKAIIDSAKKNGELPMEYSPRLVVHDMVETMRDLMSSYEVGYKKMTQVQQDACLAKLQEASEEIADLIVRVIASQGAQSVLMKLKDLKVSNGQLTGVVAADSPNFNELISKVQDKSDVLIVLYPREFSDAMDDIQSEKDQKTLPLDTTDEAPEKPASKPRASAGSGSATSAASLARKATELPAKLLQDARDFIKNQQVCTVSGIQNGLKIGAVKATAVLDQMVAENIVYFEGDDKSGEYKLVRETASNVTPIKPVEEKPKAAAVDKKVEKVKAVDAPKPTFDDIEDISAEAGATPSPEATILTEELYDQIKAKVISSKKVSAGVLSITFGVEDEVVEQAIERLELEGIVTPENDMGMRAFIKQPKATK